jgi:hypothetical protein
MQTNRAPDRRIPTGRNPMNRIDCKSRLFALALLAGILGCSQKADKATPLAPPAVEVDGFVYNEIYTCSQTFGNGAPFCADNRSGGKIQFTKTGTGTYRVRDVPDTGFVYNGTLSGLVFAWTAISPDGYTENGTWTFSSDGLGFAGISHYIADDNSYNGDCSTTGAKDPALPPAPAPIGACP